jgi:uncharacterized protein
MRIAMSAHIQLDPSFVAEFCQRNHIHKLALFGSVLTDRFRPESDVDFLVEFENGARVGLFEVAGMEIELTERLGRKVDLRTAADLSRYFRDEVVRGAEVQYSGD